MMMGWSPFGFKNNTIVLLLCLLIVFASSMISVSVEGKLVKEDSLLQAGIIIKGTTRKLLHRENFIANLHPRILKVKTNDYGRYDQPPTLEKPPFKLIPN